MIEDASSKDTEFQQMATSIMIDHYMTFYYHNYKPMITTLHMLSRYTNLFSPITGIYNDLVMKIYMYVYL